MTSKKPSVNAKLLGLYQADIEEARRIVKESVPGDIRECINAFIKQMPPKEKV